MRAKQAERGICGGIDLTEEQASLIREHLGQCFSLCEWSSDALPDLAAMEGATPCALWLSLDGFRSLAALPGDRARRLSLLPKVLLLPQKCSAEELEEAIDSGVDEIIRSPLAEKRLRKVMFRILEMQQLQQDMLCMTREMALERELLDHKNELLTFLAEFLTKTSGSLEMEALLRGAREGLSIMFPGCSLHAVLWHNGKPANRISLYVDAPEHSRAYAHWRQALLNEAAATLRIPVADISDSPHVMLSTSPDSSGAGAVQENAHLLRLPLSFGAEQLGVLLLESEMWSTLSREQALMLDSALRHLALDIKNAQRFQQMREVAEHDELTRLYNRRHFENRLNEEMSRFSRYGQPFSLLLLDVDRFKRVNDTYGHAAGDEVLRGLARAIRETVRLTDYCARYGGEEFCILLPGIGPEEAFLSAKRIQKALASQVFSVCGRELRVTVSIGITGMYPGEHKDRNTILHEADSAMYAAKAAGRNATRHYTEQRSREVV